MSHAFSDPLTSAAYASSKVNSGNDPLLLPSDAPVVASAGAKAGLGTGTGISQISPPSSSSKNTTWTSTSNMKARTQTSRLAIGGGATSPPQSQSQSQRQSYDPLTSSSPPKAPVPVPKPLITSRTHAQSPQTLAPSPISGSTSQLGSDKSASPAKQTGSTAAAASRSDGFTERSSTSSFSSPSSPITHPFSDPLVSDNMSASATESYVGYRAAISSPQTSIGQGVDVGDRESHGGSGRRPQHHRATVASFPSSPIPKNNDIGNRTSSPTTHDAQGNERNLNDSPKRAVSSSWASPHLSPTLNPSPGGSLRRESSYEQQRVKAPQYLHITIPDTNRRGKDGMFLLSVQTNMPRYKRQSYGNVTRSYLEFARLREHLVTEHPETIVPVLPPERSLNNAADLQSMRLFLERISRHPVLSQDHELQMFIESEFGFLPPARPKKILDSFLNIGVKRFSSGGGISSGSALSIDDKDDDFEEERVAALKVETKLQAVIKGLDKEIKARRDFSSKESELATLSTAWAAGESLPELARMFKVLAKPLDGMAKASKAQVGGDATVLGSFLDYKLQHVQTLSHALDYRLSVLGECDSAIKGTESKRKTMERLRSSTNINPEKVTDSIDDLEDAILFEGNMKHRLEQVSAVLNKDLEAYRLQSQQDMLRALREYSQRQVGFERAKLEELESVAGAIGVQKEEGVAE